MEQEEKTTPERPALNIVPLKAEDQQKFPQHDLQLMGKRLQLDVSALIDGYHIQYYSEVEIEMPPEIQALTGRKGAKKVNSVVSSRLVFGRWYDPFIGMTLDKRLVLGIEKMKQDLRQVEANHNRLCETLKISSKEPTPPA
jgi:hypothetical protein